MNRFWGGVGVLVALAVLLLVFESSTGVDFGGEDPITVFDLETECRANSNQSSVSLDDRRINFEGSYAVGSTKADLGYRYRESGNSLRLEIFSESRISEDETFMDDCLGQVRYRMRTPRIDTGTYEVRVFHNGEMARTTVISIE